MLVLQMDVRGKNRASKTTNYKPLVSYSAFIIPFVTYFNMPNGVKQLGLVGCFIHQDRAENSLVVSLAESDSSSASPIAWVRKLRWV